MTRNGKADRIGDSNNQIRERQYMCICFLMYLCVCYVLIHLLTKYINQCNNTFCMRCNIKESLYIYSPI